MSVFSYGGVVFSKINAESIIIKKTSVFKKKKFRSFIYVYPKIHQFWNLYINIIFNLLNIKIISQIIIEMEERLVKPLVLDRKTGREGKIKISGGTYVQLMRGGMEDLIRQKRAHEKKEREGAQNN